MKKVCFHPWCGVAGNDGKPKYCIECVQHQSNLNEEAEYEKVKRMNTEKEKPMAKYTIEYATKHKVCQYCGEPVVFHKGDGYYEGIVYAHRVCHGLPPLRKVILACEFDLEEGEVIHGFKLQTFARGDEYPAENWKIRAEAHWERGRKFLGCPKVIQSKDTSIGLTVAHLMTRDEMMALIVKYIHPIGELKDIGTYQPVDASHFLKALGFKEPKGEENGGE